MSCYVYGVSLKDKGILACLRSPFREKKLYHYFYPFSKHENKLFWHELGGNSGLWVLILVGLSHMHGLKENQWPNPSISSSTSQNRPRLNVLKQPTTNFAYIFNIFIFNTELKSLRKLPRDVKKFRWSIWLILTSIHSSYFRQTWKPTQSSKCPWLFMD